MMGWKLNPRQLAQTAELASLGLTRAQIGAALGVSYPQACRLCRLAGVPVAYDTSVGWQPTIAKARERAAAMAALYRDGYTLEQIGAVHGITRERVRQLMTKHLGIRHQDGGQAKRAAKAAAKRRVDKDAACLTKLGCTHAQYKEILRIGREMMAAGIGRERTPMGAFLRQKDNAVHHRGIGWELTFWQWWTIWQESGHWHERGRGQGYVMCRVGDLGPYAVGNVFIALATENTGYSKVKKSSLPLGVRVARKAGHYEAHRQIDGNKLYLGSFPTPEQAHAAYLMAGEQRAAA